MNIIFSFFCCLFLTACCVACPNDSEWSTDSVCKCQSSAFISQYSVVWTTLRSITVGVTIYVLIVLQCVELLETWCNIHRPTPRATHDIGYLMHLHLPPPENWNRHIAFLPSLFQLCCCLHTTSSAHTCWIMLFGVAGTGTGKMKSVQWDCGMIFKLGSMLTIAMSSDDLVQDLEYKVLAWYIQVIY